VSDIRVARNVWSGAAAALVVAALVALVAVLSGPYSSTDSKIFYTLGAALLGAAGFVAALALVARGGSLVGLAAAIASPIGFALLTYALWQDAVSSSDGEGAFWAGTVTLVTTLIAVTARLLARAQMVRWIAAASGVLAVLAALVSMDAALSNAQFWRVGAAITSLWIVATALYFLVPLFERAITGSDLWLVPAAILIGAAAVGIVAVLRGEFAPQGYSIFFTLIAAVLAAATLLGGIVSLERGAIALGWTAVAVSPLGFAMIADGIWRDSEDRYRVLSTGFVLLLAGLVALAARLFAHSPVLVRLAGVAGLLAATATAVSVEGIWRDDRFLLIEKTTTALWIVATLCCLLVPVLERYLEERALEAGVEA